MPIQKRQQLLNRRRFLSTLFGATAGGLLVPEWILDPPKGRSMVTVPDLMPQHAGVYSAYTDWSFGGDGRVLVLGGFTIVQEHADNVPGPQRSQLVFIHPDDTL